MVLSKEEEGWEAADGGWEEDGEGVGGGTAAAAAGGAVGAWRTAVGGI